MALQSNVYEFSKGNNALNNDQTIILLNSPTFYRDWAISDMYVQPTTTEDFALSLMFNGIAVRTVSIQADQTLRYINLMAELTIKESIQMQTANTFEIRGPATVPSGLTNVRGCVFVTGDTL